MIFCVFCAFTVYVFTVCYCVAAGWRNKRMTMKSKILPLFLGGELPHNVTLRGEVPLSSLYAKLVYIMLWTDLTWWKRRRERQRDVSSPGGPVTRDAGARDTPTPAGHLLSLDQTGAVGLSRDTFIRSRLNRRRYNEFGHAWNCFLSTAFVCVEFSVPRKWNAEQKSISDQLLPCTTICSITEL